MRTEVPLTRLAYFSLPVCLPVCLSGCLPVSLSVSLPVCLSAGLSLGLSVSPDRPVCPGDLCGEIRPDDRGFLQEGETASARLCLS